MKALGSAGVAVAILRESTEDQRLSAEVQRGKIQEWATREGIRIAAWFVDHDVSGTSAVSKRPGMLGALAALREHGAGVLVAAKRCRLARDLGVAATIEALAVKEGAKVRTADGMSDATGSAGIVQRGFNDVIHAWEAAVISERTTAALAVKRAKNERVGAVPYGFQLAEDGIHLAPCEAEQTTITAIRELREAGVSLRSIVGELASRGVVSRVGKPMGLTQIARIAA